MDEKASPSLTDLMSMIETLIFVSDEPISKDKLLAHVQAAHEGLTMRDVSAALTELMARWADEERPLGMGIQLKNIAGGYAFMTAQKNSQVALDLAQKKPVKLSRAQVETLAIIAYRQPITRVDVDDIRGVDSSFAIKRMLELKLVKILGKSEGLGRPLLYGTTKEFLEFFSLHSLSDLPTLKVYDALDEGEMKVDLESNDLKLKDLFVEAQARGMFSSEVMRLSEEALAGLDDAMLSVNAVLGKNATAVEEDGGENSKGVGTL